MKQYHIGDSFGIEVVFRQRIPFVGFNLSDPDTAKVTIWKQGKGSSPNVDKADLTKDSLGKWYYVVDTDYTWEKGIYNVKLEVTSSECNPTKVLNYAFEITE